MTDDALPAAAPLSAFLPARYVDDILTRAFAEDLGDRGDLTSLATIPAGRTARAVMRARETGCLAGINVAASAFRKMDDTLAVTPHRQDGERVAPGETVMEIEGDARALLSAERTALNIAGRLTGIASATRRFSDAIAHTKARICCTRKTSPGLRGLEKYAVRAGGGVNHRYGLYDGILIKDNHIAVAGGIRQAVQAALALHGGHMVKIEVEVDTLSQLREVLDLPVDAVLLDNMSPAELAEGVRLAGGRFVTEASGGINEKTLVAVAESGVDLISMGWLTHSAPCFDLGLDIDF